MKLLILGGTADARQLATAIHQMQPALELIYSVAGLVRQPQVPATVVSGGFSQFGGLSAYCQAQQVDGIVNTTHPFSIAMGEQAQKTCNQLGLAYWRFLRPQWQPKKADDWRLFNTIKDLLTALSGYQRILLTVGQVTPEELKLLGAQPHIWLRTAVAPRFILPANVSWIRAIGPFNTASELALLKEHQIQAIASKNSGGNSTEAKLTAASNLKLPVFMLKRPSIAGPVEKQFDVLIDRLHTWAKTPMANAYKVHHHEL